MPLHISSMRTTQLRELASIISVALIVMIFMLTPNPVTAAEQEQMPSDVAITNAVADELMLDPGVSDHRIVIDAEDGIVTLSGEVDNLLARERAVRVAETIKGVRAVIDQIQVRGIERSDQELVDDVKAAIQTNPRTEAYEVDVKAQNGVVTLTGRVQSWQEKELAGKMAKSVKGVKDVSNEITIAYATVRPDAEIKEDIVSALRWDRLIDDALIDVKVEDGDVTLTGTVGSAAEHWQARADAWVAGVKSVDASGLEVAYWMRDENLRKDKYVAKSDAEISNAIMEALALDPRVSLFNINVTVANGTVTLRGNVDNLSAKRAAAEIARNTIGVWRVKNRLQVGAAEPPTDEEIADKVRRALLRDPYVESYEVTVNVNNGVVMLNGTVTDSFEKIQAESVASRLEGVVDVKNNLSVIDIDTLTYNPYVDDEYVYDYTWYDYQTTVRQEDWEIREDIKDELWWSPFVDSEEVTVTVDQGVAILTGTVDTWSERRSATENALEGGAVRVINKLDVTYGPDFDLF